MNADNLANAVLDLARLGALSLRRQAPVLVLILPVCPIDDGPAALNDVLTVEHDGNFRLFQAAALGQDLVQARRPADLLVGNAMPVERPAGFLAEVRRCERYELWPCRPIRPSIAKRLALASRRVRSASDPTDIRGAR